MTPITVYKEDIENACQHLNESTVMGVRRAHNILVNMLTIAEGRPKENNTEEQTAPQPQDTKLWEICFKTHHSAILEILDMLYEVSQYTLPMNRNVMNQVKTLKAKLEVDK